MRTIHHLSSMCVSLEQILEFLKVLFCKSTCKYLANYDSYTITFFLFKEKTGADFYHSSAIVDESETANGTEISALKMNLM